MTWKHFKKYWFEVYFPHILLGILCFIGISIILFVTTIIVMMKINENNHDYCVEIIKGSHTEKFYLNEGDFELKDGRISFSDAEGTYHLTNFKIIKLKSNK